MAAFHSFFTADQYFIVYIPLLFIHSSVDGHLGCLHIFANLKNDAMNIRVHMTFQISVFIFFTCVPRNEILDHMVVLFFFIFCEYLHTIFHSSCTNLHSGEQCTGVSFPYILTNTSYLLSF